MTGLEFWFDPPPGTRVPPASPHRMALVLTLILGPLIGGWPPTLRRFLTVAMQVTLMTSVIMPRLRPLSARVLSLKSTTF